MFIALVYMRQMEQLKFFLGDSDTPRHHKAIKVGELSEALSFELNEGTVKSSNFTSGNTALFQIVKENGKTYVKAIKEGTGYVTLTVVNDSDKTFKERLLISVYKNVEKCIGIINKATDGYRGASDNADVEKEDAKGKISNGTKVDIIASCEDYYLIKTKDGRVFEDDLNTAFIKKKDLNVPISSVLLDKTNIKMSVGSDEKLTTTILPSITTEDKTVKWSSSDKKILVVYSDGTVYAKRSGEAFLYAKSGGITVCCKVKINNISTKTALSTNGKKVSVKGKKKIKKKYRYSFLNHYYAFGNKFVLDPKLRDKLADKLVKANYFTNKKAAKIKIIKIMNGNLKGKAKWKWKGSCYGMATTTALNRIKQINVRKYTKSRGKGYQISKVSAPIYNKDTENIINYYFASQVGFNEDEGQPYSVSNKTKLKKIVKNAKKQYMESFAFFMWYKKTNKYYGGHRILLLGYSNKKSNKKWHAIKCYDNAYSASDRYVFISKKYNKIKVQGWSDTYSIKEFASTTNFSKYAKIKIY